MEPFLGELRLYPIGYAPRGWVYCEGQEMQINTNQALFSLLGFTYGGNGSTTFRLPDLRGRVPIHAASGYPLGSAGGESQHTLTESEMPAHTHQVNASAEPPTANQPNGNVWAALPLAAYAPPTSGLAHMSAAGVSQAGGGQAHNNMQPYTGLHYCIAVTGIFPSRN